MNRSHAYKISLSAVLIAAALALSFFESLILPVFPIPGIKLGLANVVTLFALYFLNTGAAAIILIARCFLASFYSGGITAFIFSISGGFLALLFMTLAKSSEKLSIFGVSVAGAASHSIGQLTAASVIFSTAAVFSYLPPMLLISILTGLLTALVSKVILSRMDMFKK